MSEGGEARNHEADRWRLIAEGYKLERDEARAALDALRRSPDHEADVEAVARALAPWIPGRDGALKAAIAALDAVSRSQNPSEVGSLSLRSNFQAQDLNRSPQGEDHEAKKRRPRVPAPSGRPGSLTPPSPQDEDHGPAEDGIADWPKEPLGPQGEDHEAVDVIAEFLHTGGPSLNADQAAIEIARVLGDAGLLSRCPSPERNERVSQDHDPGRDD